MSTELKNLIAGQWSVSEKTFDKRSPFDGSLVFPPLAF